MRRFVRAVRPILLGAGVTLALGVVGIPTAAGEDAKPPKTRALTPVERTKLVLDFKAYLDPDGDFIRTRPMLAKTLAELKGFELLADSEVLSGLVYQARPFPKAPFSKRELPKEADFRAAGPIVSVSADLGNYAIKLALAMPKSYVAPDPKKPVDRPPTPLLITLHEEQDYQGPKGASKYPGEDVIRRRFDPNGPSKAVLEEWAILAPVIPKGQWIKEPPVVPPFSGALQATWDRYHVDFERFVIDGLSDALTFAAARPHLFAGVIARGDAADLAPDLVRNLGGMSVYVVGTAASAAAKTLAANGHPADRVKIGGADGLAEWLKTVRRTPPKSFQWTMKDAQMRTAHWVQITTAESSMTPTMEVSVVDTAEDPNTIRINTKGVRGISVLLSDRVVDLDREVRVVLNRQPLKTAHMLEGNESREIKLPAKVQRSVETAFSARPLTVRKNLLYGMLFSAILDGIQVDGDDPGEAPPEAPAKPGDAKPGDAPADGAKPAPDAPPEATSAEKIEGDAKRKFERAEGYEKEGNLEFAVKLYKQVVDLGASTFKERAEAKLKEIEAKGSAPK